MADTTSKATGTFTIKGWDEQPYAETEGAAKLTHARVTTGYTGDLGYEIWVAREKASRVRGATAASTQAAG